MHNESVILTLKNKLLCILFFFLFLTLYIAVRQKMLTENQSRFFSALFKDINHRLNRKPQKWPYRVQDLQTAASLRHSASGLDGRPPVGELAAYHENKHKIKVKYPALSVIVLPTCIISKRCQEASNYTYIGYSKAALKHVFGRRKSFFATRCINV